MLAMAILSLLVIGFVLFTGISKKHSTETKKENFPQILGEIIGPGDTVTPTPLDVNRLFQDSLENTKEIVMQKTSEKVSEVEKIVVNTINREISNLSQSQLDALKVQICRDLGVISPLPTKQP